MESRAQQNSPLTSANMQSDTLASYYMRKVLLLFNPASGRRRAHRRKLVDAVAEVLRGTGATVEVDVTGGHAGAIEKSRRAVAAGYDTIVACGGDGTVHDVGQALIGTDVALGIIPAGTANALAHDIGLPRDARKAAQMLTQCVPQRIQVGRVEFESQGKPAQRYFVVTTGVGVDAELFYALVAVSKERLGMMGYYLEALKQWATQKYVPFEVKFHDAAQNRERTERITQLLAVRISDFGGVLHRLAPGASLHRPDFQLILFRTRSRIRFLRFIIGRMLFANWSDPQIELVHASRVECHPVTDAQSKHRIHVEADGELLGTIRCAISIAPVPLLLLVPPTFQAATQAVSQ